MRKKLQKIGFEVQKKHPYWIVRSSEHTFCVLSMRVSSHRQLLIQDGKWMWLKHLLRYGQIDGVIDNSNFVSFSKETTEMIKVLCIKGKDVPIYIQTRGMHRRFLQLTDKVNTVHIMNDFELLSFLQHYPFAEEIHEIVLDV